jgi:tellurite methyltransferase
LKPIIGLLISILISTTCYAQHLPPLSASDIVNQPMSEWSAYLDETAVSDVPSKPIQFALSLYKKENINTGYAVDLGAGSGKDTLFLLRHHWRVLAIDYSSQAIKTILQRAAAANLPQPETMLSSFQAMQLPHDIDLINANLSLPFIPPEDFFKVWQNVVTHLRVGGRFSGNFFGVQDAYASNKNNAMTFLTKAQLKQMFQGFKIESLTTRQGFYPQADGKTKYWQIWDVVAKKVI